MVGRLRPRGLPLGYIVDLSTYGSETPHIGGVELTPCAYQPILRSKITKRTRDVPTYFWTLPGLNVILYAQKRRPLSLVCMGYDVATRKDAFDTFTAPDRAQENWLARNRIKLMDWREGDLPR